MDILKHSITGLPAFGLYFATCAVMIAIFLALYVRITPYREIALIREGNAAAAASLSGALLGFAVPLARSVTQSANLADMVLWGSIALVVQILVFWVVSRILPQLAQDIPQGKTAQGVFLGAVSLATGILNAACMTY
jgi:putative membrane protein